MSLPPTNTPATEPVATSSAAAPTTTATESVAVSWSQELKERLERLAKATSVGIDPYPGTPAYIAARKLEETIESTWRAYLVELVRNDIAAGASGRRKHHWQKNECLIVYELVEGAQLEEFPGTDSARREDYLSRTVRNALYIKTPQFSSNFTFPWPSPTVSTAFPTSSVNFANRPIRCIACARQILTHVSFFLTLPFDSFKLTDFKIYLTEWPY